jgi:hypothetical protein
MSKAKILLMVAALTGAFAALCEFNATVNSPETLIEQAVARQLFSNLDKAERIVISRPLYGNSVSFSLDGDKWSIREPIVDAINLSALGLLFNEFNDLRMRDLPPNLNNQTAADLGLDTPRFVVETYSTDGIKHTLLIGAPSVQSDFGVGQFDGNTCLVPNSFVSILSRSIDSWRDPRLSSLGSKLQKVEWQSVDSQYSFTAYKNDNIWRFTEPFDGLFSLNASSLLDSALGARIASLGAPLTSNYLPGAKLGKLLLSGKGENVGLDVYSNSVVSSERAFVLHVSSQRFAILQQPPLALRSQRLLDFNPQHLSAVVVRYRQENFVLVKSSEGWRDAIASMRYDNNIIVDLIDQVRLAKFSDSSKARPAREADGMIAMSISRVPRIDKCPQLLWWVDSQERVWVGSKDSKQVYLSEVNLELGVKAIFAVKH